MAPFLWAKAHGASTHFPLACALCSPLFDAAGLLLQRRPSGLRLRAAGYWTMAVAAFGTVPAVLSGLLMTKGAILGHDALRLHHLFVWPAFLLLIGLGAWRVLQEKVASPRSFAIYLILAGVAASLTAAAGYWGGEMMIAR